jgi:hypothetical protein
MQTSVYSRSFDEFRALASQGNLIPCSKSIFSPLIAFAEDTLQVGE